MKLTVEELVYVRSKGLCITEIASAIERGGLYDGDGKFINVAP